MSPSPYIASCFPLNLSHPEPLFPDPPPPRPLPRPRPKLEGAFRGGEGQVQNGIDAAPSQWPRGYSRLGSGLGTVPAFSAHHYRRARASPSTAPGHARAATHARHAIRRAHRATRRPTPAAL
eukprot:scaffold43012_cov49-Phaeocystis_antarctica.AAC.11